MRRRLRVSLLLLFFFALGCGSTAHSSSGDRGSTDAARARPSCELHAVDFLPQESTFAVGLDVDAARRAPAYERIFARSASAILDGDVALEGVREVGFAIRTPDGKPPTAGSIDARDDVFVILRTDGPPPGPDVRRALAVAPGELRWQDFGDGFHGFGVGGWRGWAPPRGSGCHAGRQVVTLGTDFRHYRDPGIAEMQAAFATIGIPAMRRVDASLLERGDVVWAEVRLRFEDDLDDGRTQDGLRGFFDRVHRDAPASFYWSVSGLREVTFSLGGAEAENERVLAVALTLFGEEE
ncbi:MAG TPA: hypothetical protein RMH85_14900 [Polyangiaceae bacterium LLY-WYZ-15_(1-7)]|nr:hypothetical protein [Myxococcales bacterium]MAT28212.1 hypothetical protein [Sandaracinus sp.]HJK91410.1 hypothetical protein [Polyangiaceae bacterium LLY-WYZ-15_(1-7)]HJL05964.1 hypothetical protein [Polyangiaceae bacterium LLY-WYZ-15_(1-7)]HJL09785.1 hypothetical protein [Polyangiaceae bacterium LLY-WYZ-15_(1-7)]